MDNRRCWLCKWWHKGNLYRTGECHRRAPIAATETLARWPLTALENSCGDWEETNDARDEEGYTIPRRD